LNLVLSDKLVEMFKYRHILIELKQDIEHKDGLSQGYNRTEGKHFVDTMIKFRSSHLKTVLTQRTKDLDENFQPIVNKSRSENYVAAYNAL